MKRAILAALGTGTIVSGMAIISIGAAVNAEPPALSRAEYHAALAGIEAARPQVLARCEEGAAGGRELCRAQADADEMVRVADLDANFRRDRESTRAAQRARIEARYQVDRASCAALSGFKRDRCQIAAHAARGRALLEVAAPYEVRS
jgi:Spy/CpxP family protein refolding chaperone